MNRFRDTRQFFLAALSALLMFFTSAVFAVMDFPTLSEEEYKALSPAERQEYEKNLKTHIEQMSPAEQEAFMQQEVEKLYQSLPPEQQKEVLEEAARIEKMSEEEQRAYFKQVERELEDMFGQQQAQTAAPAPQEAQEKETAEPDLIPDEPAKKVTAAPQISNEEKALKEAVNLINEIAQAMDDVSTKMESMINLQFKFSSWGKKKKITAWDGGFEWKKLKEKISTFRGQLEKLKDRDTTTKKHKYLPHLLENKALYTQLYNLSVDLAENEPTVRGGTNESVTPQIRARSNKALRSLIKSFTDLFYSDDIIAALNKLFVKFDPEAKKIAGKEAKATQKALAQSKQPVSSSSVKVAGSSRERESRYGGYGDDYGSAGRGGYGAGSSSAYPSSPYGDTGYKGLETSDKGAGTGDKAASPSKGGETTAKAPEVKDAQMDKRLKSFERKIEPIAEALGEVPTFKDISSYLNKGTVDIEFAKKQAPDLRNDLIKATNYLGTVMEKLKTLSGPTKSYYKKDIKISIDLVSKDIEKLVSNLANVSSSKINYSDEMMWAHFGQEPKDLATLVTKGTATNAQPQDKRKAKVYTEIESPMKLQDLKQAADDFLKKVREFNSLS